jgi:predicted methyltransferase
MFESYVSGFMFKDFLEENMMGKLTQIAMVIVCLSSAACSYASVTGVEEAVTNPARTDKDKALDVKRKPAEVLEFFGIEPGMKVLDIFGGGGYYAELLSYLVGESGSVTLYNNSPWNNFVNKNVTERLKDNRLPNVERLVLEPTDLDSVEGNYNAAIFILGMHDIYYTDEENGWLAIDRDGFLTNIHRLLKDGGVLGIIDHNAMPGSDPSIVGKTVHRIDPAVIIKDVTAAGFILESEADILRNSDDDLETTVFDESMRWKSDRSVLKFRK